MSFLETYLLCALGIIVSIVLPLLRNSLPRPLEVNERGETEEFVLRVWRIAKPYIALGIFSLVAGIVIVAIGGDFLKDWRTALLAGYAWDSTLQKATRGLS